MKKYFVVFGLLVLLASGSYFVLSPQEPPMMPNPEGLQGLIIQSPPSLVPEFSLTTHLGEMLSKKNLKGTWSLVFFGYTNCPDVCPATMRVMSQVGQDESTPKDTQYIFISVDPRRDTTENLKSFIEYFNPEFVAASGAKQEIDKFKEPLGVIYDFEGDTNSQDYIVTHFAAIYIINPAGKLRAYVLPPHSFEQVSRAYREIRNYYTKE